MDIKLNISIFVLPNRNSTRCRTFELFEKLMNYKIKCKDYIIFKIRYYADPKLRKYSSSDVYSDEYHMYMENQKIRADSYFKFIQKFIEYTTGKSRQWWFSNYMFDTIECGFEYLEENDKVLIQKGEGDDILMIPKEKVEWIEWVKLNLTNPYKIVSGKENNLKSSLKNLKKRII